MMDFILSLIGGFDIWGYIVAGIGALASVLGIYFKGRKDANRKNELEDAHEHIDTRKRIDQVVEDSRRDGGTWHDRLRRDRDQR